jgi:hypothetical protein
VGFDPCLVAKEKDMFSEYSEVSVEFQPADIYGNLLPLNLCQVYECGVRPLDTEYEIYRFALPMQGHYRICSLDRDELEAMFQARRGRFEGMMKLTNRRNKEMTKSSQLSQHRRPLL